MPYSSSSVDLSWSAPVYIGPYPITGYRITGPSGTVFVTGTTYTFYGLTPAMTYSFTAETVNEFQTSSPTSTLGVTSPVQSLLVYSVYGSLLTGSWRQSTNWTIADPLGPGDFNNGKRSEIWKFSSSLGGITSIAIVSSTAPIQPAFDNSTAFDSVVWLMSGTTSSIIKFNEDAGFASPPSSSDGWTSGFWSCIASQTIAPNTDYFIDVSSWDVVNHDYRIDFWPSLNITATLLISLDRIVQQRVYDYDFVSHDWTSPVYNTVTGLLDTQYLYENVSSGTFTPFTGSGCLPTGSRQYSSSSNTYNTGSTLLWNGTDWYMPTGLNVFPGNNAPSPGSHTWSSTSNWMYVWFEPGLSGPDRVSYGSGFSETTDIRVEGAGFDGSETVQVIRGTFGGPDGSDQTTASTFVDRNLWLVSMFDIAGSDFFVRVTKGAMVVESKRFNLNPVI